MIKKIWNESTLRIIFIIYLLISRISILGYHIHDFYITVFMSIFAILTVFFYIYNRKYHLKIFFSQKEWIPFLFMMLCLLTSYLNVGRLPLFSFMSQVVIFYLLLYGEKTKTEVDFMSQILVNSISIVTLISLVCACFEMLGYPLVPITSFFQETRFVGVIRFYDSPNGVAITAFVGMALSLYYFHKNKILYGIFALGNFISILWTGSRSSLFGLILFLLIMAFFIIHKYKNKIGKKLLYGIIFVVLTGVWFFFYDVTINRIAFIKEFIKVENSSFLDHLTNYRYSLYKEAVILGMQSPLIGNGLNTFVVTSKALFKETSMAAIFTGENPHNVFLALFYYTGFIGLVLMGYVFYQIFKKNIHILKKECIFENYCLFGLLAGVFAFSMLDVNILFHVQITGYLFWFYAFSKNNESQI